MYILYILIIIEGGMSEDAVLRLVTQEATIAEMNKSTVGGLYK